MQARTFLNVMPLCFADGSTSSGKAQRLKTVPEVEPTKAHDSGQGKSGFGGEKRLKSPDRLMKAMDQLWGSY